MGTDLTSDLPGVFWLTVGVVGGAIFYGRYYVQWIASEIRRASFMPTAFWYMSSVGSVMLLAFAVVSRSPLGALGQCFNIVIYGRNLAHIFRERGQLSGKLNIALHGTMFVVASVAVGFMVSTWLHEFRVNRGAPEARAYHSWFWLAVGVVGQALFAGRFLVQWIATELRRRSVVPDAFWYLSILAATLQSMSFVQRGEWVFAVGVTATIFIYARNIWFIHRGHHVPAAQ